MRTTAPGELTQGLAHRTSQLGNVISDKRSGGTSRIESGPPQDFVGQQVSQTGQSTLVHESRFQWRFAVGEDRREFPEGHLGCVRTQCCLIRIKFDATEPPGVAHTQRSPVIEMQDETLPLRVATMTRIFECVDGVMPVDIKHPRHPESKTKRGSGGFEQQEFADPTIGNDPLIDERCGD